MRLTKTPYLQCPTTDGMTVSWETDAPGGTVLRVWDCLVPGIPNTYERVYLPTGDARVFEGETGCAHRVRACGLKPRTLYCYQAFTRDGESECASDICTFVTAPEKGTAFHAVLTAETGGANQPHNVPGIIRQVELARPDLLLFMGDAVWDGAVETDWDEHFFTPFAQLFAGTPFCHVIGNHDAEGRGIIKRLMAHEPMHSFSYGDARFIVLDTTRFAARARVDDTSTDMLPFDSFTPQDAQWQALERELAQTCEPWTFVLMHYPPYASSLFAAPCMRRLCPLFEQYKVDAVFTSHTLHYERTFPLKNGLPDRDGTVYFVIGGVGEFPQWVHMHTLPTTACIMPKPHYATLEVTPFSASVKAFDERGAMFDCWSKTK